MPRLQTVHVRVNDAATGKPTPCRVRFTDGDRTYYPPRGRPSHFATSRNQDVGGNVRLGAKNFAYIDGTCEIDLPPGTIQVDASKGPEYVALAQHLLLKPGKLALRLQLERWINLPQEGWFSGDSRVHFLTPHAALLEAQAEDVHVVNLLALATTLAGPGEEKHTAFSNVLAFSGKNPVLADADHMVVVNTLNAHPDLGSLALLNCHRVVYPLTFGGPDGREDWTLADWCDQCHRKQGLVVWTHTTHECAAFHHGEPLADLLLGKIDAFEIDHFEDSPFDVLPLWYDLLNVGLRLPLVGASGKDSNHSALGVMRTYAHIPAPLGLTYARWIEAVRAGRTFVSNGPILLFSVNGQPPGSTFELAQPDGQLQVRLECKSLQPWQRLEVMCNGLVVAQGGTNSILEQSVSIATGGWLAGRCIGDAQIFDRPANQRLFAHSAPVYVDVKGQPRMIDRAAFARLDEELDHMHAWALSQARCESDEQRQRLASIFAAAKEKLHQRLTP